LRARWNSAHPHRKIVRFRDANRFKILGEDESFSSTPLQGGTGAFSFSFCFAEWRWLLGRDDEKRHRTSNPRT